MFIEVVRDYIASLSSENAGWLAGLRDPLVGRVLSLIHAKPTEDWTIDRLAKEVGASRSVLAERFSEIVGIPPMHYLAKWRMQIASELLSGSTAKIATIAVEAGYKSEAAFSRAFKKMIGMSPATWRQRVRREGC
jgi:transcriptional regulator GlxA family with amidase domain